MIVETPRMLHLTVHFVIAFGLACAGSRAKGLGSTVMKTVPSEISSSGEASLLPSGARRTVPAGLWTNLIRASRRAFASAQGGCRFPHSTTGRQRKTVATWPSQHARLLPIRSVTRVLLQGMHSFIAWRALSVIATAVMLQRCLISLRHRGPLGDDP